MLATQNPVEFHGTYPLPEAQLDRFGVRVGLGYPSAEHEVDVLFAQAQQHPLERRWRRCSPPRTCSRCRRRPAAFTSSGRSPPTSSRSPRRRAATRSVQLGCSPRGSLMLFRAAQARALLEGRRFAVPEDVKRQAVAVLAHRLGLETKARYSGVAKQDVVGEILDATAVPA